MATVRCEQTEPGIWQVTLDRPEKRNAMTLEMYQAFQRVFDDLNARQDVRCIVVQGAGGAFCAGSDIGTFGDDRDGVERARAYADLTISCTDSLKNCPYPTIACIDGACVGGGLEIAAMCDFRLASERSRFGIPVNRIGLVLDHRELEDLIQLVGASRTLEILLEGRVFDASEALTKGLLTAVVPQPELVQRCQETARRIAAGAPLANRWHKKFVRQLAARTPLTSEDREEAYVCFGTEDYRIGVAAFGRKEKPRFVGR